MRRSLPLAAAVLLLAGCQGTPTETPETDVTAQDLSALGSKPDVTVPDGTPPDELVTEDLIEGDGAEATVGASVTVHYVGVAWSTGQQFDASWDRDQPFGFTLGEGRVISGWERGVEGMRVGGRRQLIIPPELGYGDRGAGGVIAPGETLIFVVDLLAVS